MAVILVFTVIILLSLFLFSGNEKSVNVKNKTAPDDNMVYFDVNSQNTPETMEKQQPKIDDSELNADEYNKKMMETITQKPSINLPKEEEIPTETFVIPQKSYKKHHAQKSSNSQPRTYYRQRHSKYNYANACVEKILKPSKNIFKKMPCFIKQLPFVEETIPLRSIKAVKIEYANAYEIADFINKNIPTKEHKLATAKGGSEIILAGPYNNIETAEKIITLLDTHPKVAVFKLNYTKPFKMSNMIANSVFGGECNVSAEGDEKPCKTSPFTIYYNNTQNSITVVGASSKQMDLVQEFVNFSDVKSPQAFLDILFVEFNEQGSKQFQKLAQFNVSQCGSEYGISGQNLYSSISDIICNGGGKILAKPRLTIANDSDYNINVTSDYVHSRQGKYVYNIEDCGTRLKIHSVINPKGEVFLTLEPHYVTVKRSIPNERNAKATLFNKRCFRYENIKLQNCQTLCFGGVNSQQEYISFGRKKTVNTELMMFVNVRVLD